jgi:hypothetical protein
VAILRSDSCEIAGTERETPQLTLRTLYYLFAALADGVQVWAGGHPNQPMTEDAAKQLAHT